MSQGVPTCCQKLSKKKNNYKHVYVSCSRDSSLTKISISSCETCIHPVSATGESSGVLHKLRTGTHAFFNISFVIIILENVQQIDCYLYWSLNFLLHPKSNHVSVSPQTLWLYTVPTCTVLTVVDIHCLNIKMHGCLCNYCQSLWFVGMNMIILMCGNVQRPVILWDCVILYTVAA